MRSINPRALPALAAVEFAAREADAMIGSRYNKSKVLTFDERIDPASTALVVIDVQNDFALPQGVCGKVGDEFLPSHRWCKAQSADRCGARRQDANRVRANDL